MAEADAEHQRKMESSALEEAVGATKRGQFFGLAIGLAAFITAMFAVYHGCQTTASIVGGTTVLGLVTVFVTGRIKDPQEKMIDAKKDSN